VRGGIHALVKALVHVAEKLGVELRYGTTVRRIAMQGSGVTGVETDDGFVPASIVVSNADIAHVFGTLTDLAPPARTRSMSGWTAVARARRREGRVAHTVVFPERYDEEFADVFDRNRPPTDPTVYLCAQERAHGRAGWADGEPVFLMANAPADPSSSIVALREAALDRARASGELDAADVLVWERSPADLARRFPGSDGALYGAASNGAFAAFRRPANRVPGVRGLYLASGSAHPGGGMPLCVLSGRAAAAAALQDQP
jgi:1-hydroxycarotenoid 3,4-desaturase